MARHLAEVGEAAKLFWKALDFAEEAHDGQWRKSGEPYIRHPCAVARILVEDLDIKDPEILAAALLHDTVEDVEEVTVELVDKLFGPNVAAIVDGCTKITQSSRDRQTFYKLVHQKLFSGAASRLEVMLVKLADRLHNLRTLDALPRHKRQKIADETLDIYAPLAKVMGLFNLKRELYDLALGFKFPRQGHKLEVSIRQMADNQAVAEIVKQLRQETKKLWIDCEITPRAKGLWGYYDPVHKRLDKDIERPVEFIIVVNDIQTCYQALGLLNQNFPPIPRTIRDFIANPKPTGYQGLHAKANIKGQNFLFKIRTPQMEKRNQRGILKVWSTKAAVPDEFEMALREMFSFLGTEDLFSHREMIAATGKKEIYTYTPKGDLVCLPRQSTVLDFAYHVHTGIGKRCVAALIGRNRVGVEHVLHDGNQVKVITQKEPVFFDPNLQEICQTPRARSGLSRGFKVRRQTLALEVGQVIVQQEMKRYGLQFEILENEGAAEILARLAVASLAELFLAVGEGRLQLRKLIEEVLACPYGGQANMEPPTGVLNRIYLSTLDPVCVKFSACCKPLPTDKRLIGLLDERGLSVHKHDCERFGKLNVQREDVVELRWRLKKTPVVKPQTLYVPEASRNRLMMLVGVAPEQMRISEIIALTSRKNPAWEINFHVDTLQSLRSTLDHFSKGGLTYEFVLDQ